GIRDCHVTGVQTCALPIYRAARAAGRDPASIRLVAVSKTFPPEAVRAAAACGQVDFGENRVQEALPKIEAVADLPLVWHLVGHRSEGGRGGRRRSGACAAS